MLANEKLYLLFYKLYIVIYNIYFRISDAFS